MVGEQDERPQIQILVVQAAVFEDRFFSLTVGAAEVDRVPARSTHRSREGQEDIGDLSSKFPVYTSGLRKTILKKSISY